MSPQASGVPGLRWGQGLSSVFLPHSVPTSLTLGQCSQGTRGKQRTWAALRLLTNIQVLLLRDPWWECTALSPEARGGHVTGFGQRNVTATSNWQDGVDLGPEDNVEQGPRQPTSMWCEQE